jgi:hypothetical protein
MYEGFFWVFFLYTDIKYFDQIHPSITLSYPLPLFKAILTGFVVLFFIHVYEVL